MGTRGEEGTGTTAGGAAGAPPAPRPVRVGVLIAGGESRRMGRDKRMLTLDGATLVERNLTVLADIFPRVCLSLRDVGQAPAGLASGVEVIPDDATGSPLAGLASVLAAVGEPVFALAADIVDAERDAIERVCDAFVDVDVALPVAGAHLQPLHAVYAPACVPHMRRLLAAGSHRVLDLLPLVRVATVPFATEAPFFNVNTPRDWDEAEARRRRR